MHRPRRVSSKSGCDFDLQNTCRARDMQRCEQYDAGQGVCKMLVGTGAGDDMRRSALPENLHLEAPRRTAPLENVLSGT